MKNKEYFIEWVKKAGIRAIKTIAQTFVATVGTTAAINKVDWIMVVSASLMSGVLSLATSVAGLPEVGFANSDTEANSEATPEAIEEKEEEVATIEVPVADTVTDVNAVAEAVKTVEAKTEEAKTEEVKTEEVKTDTEVVNK